ncbi:hypothetical protein [uncultured Helicobacter sp.]
MAGLGVLAILLESKDSQKQNTESKAFIESSPIDSESRGRHRS